MRENKQDKISAIYLKMLENRSFNDISVKDIADECSISVRTFYNYFRDKHQVAEYFYDSHVAAFKQLPFGQFYMSVLHFLHGNCKGMSNLFSYSGQNNLHRYISRDVLGELCRHISSNVFQDAEAERAKVSLDSIALRIHTTIQRWATTDAYPSEMVLSVSEEGFVQEFLYSSIRSYYSTDPLPEGQHIVLSPMRIDREKSFLFCLPEEI